jgi:hypothetical protein
VQKTRPAATQAELSGTRRLSSLKLDPGTFGPPVSAALVLSPPVLAALGERPIITVDVEIELGLVILLLVDVPAIA